MPVYQIISLVDITRTNPHRSETDTVKLSQQANFNSLIQTIGLRSNVAWEQDPQKQLGIFPPPFEGHGTFWTWDFFVEREDVFLKDNIPVRLLIDDLHNVPVLIGLKETVDIYPAAFQTYGKHQNIHLEIKV